MTISISREQARRFLANYHFTPTDLPGVFNRLGTVQYDPLNPVGRNPDLVFQARIPGYRLDTLGGTDLELAALLDSHRLTDRRCYAHFNSHAVGAQVSGEVSSGYL